MRNSQLRGKSGSLRRGVDNASNADARAAAHKQTRAMENAGKEFIQDGIAEGREREAKVGNVRTGNCQALRQASFERRLAQERRDGQFGGEFQNQQRCLGQLGKEASRRNERGGAQENA